MTEKTALQRDILIEWYHNPEATNAEIADAVDCSRSYVAEVKDQFEDYDEFQATLDEETRLFEERTGLTIEEMKAEM